MSWFEREWVRIHYEQEGQGEPLLFLPGWAGSIDEFGSIRTSLSQHFSVTAADLPGSGWSGPQPRSYTPSYYHDDANTFLEMLDEVVGVPAHVIGFSDGGEVALLMAEKRPEAVRSVVTWGAAGKVEAPPGMLDAFYHLVDEPIPPLKDFAAYLKEMYGEDNARAMTRSASQALREIIEAGGDIARSQAHRIGCPTLLMTGDNDRLCPPGLVSELAAEIPLGEFVLVEAADHDFHQERPEWLAETIIDWLRPAR